MCMSFSGWWFPKIFLKMFIPYLGKWSNFTNIFFQMGWSHQLVFYSRYIIEALRKMRNDPIYVDMVYLGWNHPVNKKGIRCLFFCYSKYALIFRFVQCYEKHCTCFLGLYMRLTWQHDVHEACAVKVVRTHKPSKCSWRWGSSCGNLSSFRMCWC